MMSMQNKKSDSYFSRNKKWLSPLVILAFCLLSSQVWKIIGESNVSLLHYKNCCNHCAFHLRI
jgi:hypothetical protein